MQAQKRGQVLRSQKIENDGTIRKIKIKHRELIKASAEITTPKHSQL